MKIINRDEIDFFLKYKKEENESENELEKIVNEDGINLANVNNRLRKLIEKKKSENKNFNDDKDKKEIKNIKV